jgi:hypothetical protein
MTEIDDDGFANFRANAAAKGMKFGNRPPVIYVDPTEDPEQYENRDYVMVCDICEGVLNHFTFPEGQSWVHGQNWKKFDHEPVPKKLMKNEHKPQLCDFCGHDTQPLVWAFTTSQRIQAQSGNTVHDYGKTWGSCSLCAPYVLNNDLDGLIERSMRVGPIAQKFKTLQEKQVLRTSLYEMLGPVMATLASREWIGPKREPAKLDPRMMPKVHAGLIKHWGNPTLYDRVVGSEGFSNSVPGVHMGASSEFAATYPPGFSMPRETWNKHTEHIVRNLQSSANELYWVSADFTALAAMASHDFDSVTLHREDLPSPAGLIVWESPIGVVQRPGGEAAIRAISWNLVPNGIWVNAYIQGEDADPEVDVTQMRAEWGYLLCPNSGAGIPYDHEFGENMPEQVSGLVMTMFSTWFLLNQPGVAEISTAPVDKKLERVYKRNRTPLPTVKLVNLRRTPSRSHREDAQSAGERRKLSHRRYTKGHWKRQFYGPKRGLRKMIYISPYISGDANLPLREKAPVVKVLR